AAMDWRIIAALARPTQRSPLDMGEPGDRSDGRIRPPASRWATARMDSIATICDRAAGAWRSQVWRRSAPCSCITGGVGSGVGLALRQASWQRRLGCRYQSAEPMRPGGAPRVGPPLSEWIGEHDGRGAIRPNADDCNRHACQFADPLDVAAGIPG